MTNTWCARRRCSKELDSKSTSVPCFNLTIPVQCHRFQLLQMGYIPSSLTAQKRPGTQQSTLGLQLIFYFGIYTHASSLQGNTCLCRVHHVHPALPVLAHCSFMTNISSTVRLPKSLSNDFLPITNPRLVASILERHRAHC